MNQELPRKKKFQSRISEEYKITMSNFLRMSMRKSKWKFKNFIFRNESWFRGINYNLRG